ALATAGRVLDEPAYVAAARRAADFVLTRLRDERGRLLKRYCGGEAGLPAHLDDYAFVVWGLLELYEAAFEVRDLEAALTLTRQMLEHFWDEDAGGLFFTADDGEELPLRTKTAYDGAIPSGNSVAMLNLLRLARITGDAEFERKASAIASA
ncbi:MAG: thioredoxin domain-containing protein, partial [Phycisphaerae bacterium]|nr:thioredoxin domain-containing protein [Phycisphaerae bacterium]